MSTLAPTLQAFFTHRLAQQRQASPHTVAAYRDTFRRLFAFFHQRTGKAPSQLEIEDLDAPLIGAFLQHLEHGRGNSVRTRNALLARMLDPNEFLSEYGIRAISRYHLEHPYRLEVDGSVHEVRYEPGESSTGLFGGNSNWRGPIWFPINFLLVEAIQKFHHYYGDSFLVESPTGSGQKRTLWQIAAEISRRLESIFVRGVDGRRPVFGEVEFFQRDVHWRDYVPFHEYFHGDSGRGVGASHQTGWTGVVAKLLEQTTAQMAAPRAQARDAGETLVEAR